MDAITDYGPKRGSIEVTRCSDNLLAPTTWVGEIRKHPGKAPRRVEYAVQFVGQDEGKAAEWHEAKTVATARKAIKDAVKAYTQNGKDERLP